jgi:hypothetical protein
VRLLIAAGGTASGPEALPPGVMTLVNAASHIYVLSPVLVTRLQWLTYDVDQARHVSDERLATVLGQLEPTQATTSGSRGDELPMTAFGDAVRDFDPDHLLIAYPKQKRSTWQERNLVEKLFERFRLPITIFEVS